MKKVLVFCLLSLLSSYYLSCQAGTWTSGNTTVTTSGSTLTVSGNGAMEDYSAGSAPWYSAAGSIHNIVINEGVTHIGENAFYYFSHTGAMNSITIPTSVKSFGVNAFNDGEVNVIYYAGTPNEWADIDFRISGSYLHSHPFSGGIVSDHKIYFYNQKTTETKIIVFTPGLTTIRPYIFYMAGNITDVHIPHSVTSIGKQAFYYCEQLCRISILNTSAPTTSSTDVFNRMKSGGDASWLYLPTYASASTSAPGFKRLPWYDNTASGKGAARIGYQNTDKCASSTGNNFSTPTGSKVYPVSGTVNGISWSLDNDGVLTFNGSGAITTSFVISSSSDAQYPWYRMRYLVHKVVVKGNITGLSNALQRFEAMEEIEIQQTSIPTASATLPTYVFCDQTVLRIPLALINDAKLDQTPWSNMKLTVSDVVVIDQDANNTEVLNAVHDKLSAPFTMELTRSLTNASYNSFCSPIDITDIEGTFGAGTKIHKLASTSYDEEENQLTLNFSDSESSIEAGVPYIIQPANNVSNPTFTNVDPSTVVATGSSTDATHVVFHGALSPVEVSQAQIDAKNFIFLGASNTLTWANGGTLKGLRSYFTLKAGVPAHALAKRPILHIGNDNTPTAIENVQRDDVQCTKVLRDGQLYLMYKGTMYNVQGQRIQ